jgi:acyl-CoA synthetase (AMP-forming)/AMP-acid ligase II
VWKQRKVVAALDAMMAAMRLHPDRDICFNWTPLYHDMGLVNNFFLCLANGVPLVMQTPQDFVKRPVSWLRGLHATGATTTWSPNFGFAITARSARDADLEGVRLDHVRAFWNAAERIHLETILAFRDRFASYGVRPEALKTNFGCAENVGGATFSDPDGPFVCEWVDRAALYDRHVAVPMAPPAAEVIPVVSAGRAAPGLELYVVSRTGKPLPEGRVGEVALRTPSRLEGYLGDRRATRRAQLRDLLRTGDLGYLRRGELFWVGRVRERINVFGKKLDPSDFEAVLLKVDGLREGCFAAFGVDDGERGTQRLVVVSEVRDEIGREPEELIEEVRDRVAKDLGVDVSEVLLVPRGSLTKTSSGKRRHRHFRQLYLEGKLQEQRLQLQSV